MKKIVLAAVLLALVVIVLGAYTRLTDAGLGCSDWPSCYGHLTVSSTDSQIKVAEAALPERPIEAHKAWNEMIHRYFAATLGFLILIIFVWSVVKRAHYRPAKLPFFLLCLVAFQGALGMWTVALNLSPIVVMGQLLGGLAVLSCLYLLYLRLSPYRIPGGDLETRKFAKFSAIGIVILVCQISLGGWTSANYAAMACYELPLCQDGWVQQINIAGAFRVPDAIDYELGAHDAGERIAIHVAHRIGAVITFLYLCWLAIRLYANAHSSRIKNLSVLMVVTLGVQVALGVSNVVFTLPLTIAVLHNAVAACLLLVMVQLSYTLYRKT